MSFITLIFLVVSISNVLQVSTWQLGQDFFAYTLTMTFKAGNDFFLVQFLLSELRWIVLSWKQNKNYINMFTDTGDFTKKVFQLPVFTRDR